MLGSDRLYADYLPGEFFEVVYRRRVQRRIFPRPSWAYATSSGSYPNTRRLVRGLASSSRRWSSPAGVSSKYVGFREDIMPEARFPRRPALGILVARIRRELFVRRRGAAAIRAGTALAAHP